MTDREKWLKLVPLIAEGGITTASCPNCKRISLDFRYIVSPTDHIGYLLLWCNSCLHGISVSRVRAPKDVAVRWFDDPDALKDIPDFTRHE